MTYPHGGASQIWRDGDGVAHKPDKAQIRDWGARVELSADGPWIADVASIASETFLTYATGLVGAVTAGDIVRTRKEGFAYQVAASEASDQHLTTAGGVKLYIADPLVSPAHYGADPTGAVDAAPFVETVLQNHNTCYLGGSENTWLWSSQIGVPDQTLYDDTAFRILGDGATVILGGVDRALTSAGEKASPGTSANVYSGKGELCGVNFIENAASTLFDGDRLYNWYIHHNSFDGITKLIASSVAKDVGYPNGYLQSLSFCHNNVSQCAWIVDAKRAFNCTFNNNMFEACGKGIYIDGSGQPSVFGLSVRDNVFEGANGLFLKLGDYIGLDVSGNYLEANTGGDVDAYKCYIYVDGTASQSLTGKFDTLHAGLTAAQIADADFRLINFGNTTILLRRTSINNCWTNGRLVTDERALLLSGNSAAALPDVPRPSQGASIDFMKVRVSESYANNLSADNLTIAKFTLPLWDTTSQTLRPFSIKLNCLLHFLSAGSVMVGGHHFEINLLIMGSEGAVGNSKFVSAELVGDLAVPAGQVISPGASAAVTVNHFSSPALSISESAGVYSLVLSGFAAPAVTDFGASTQFTNSMTAMMFAANRSDFSASRVGQIVWTA